MPANEQTWYDPKLMHRIFGVSSVIMLIATIWMFAADHNREWKPAQRSANQLETTLTDWRKLQLASEENNKKQQQLKEQIAAAGRQPLDTNLVQAFKSQVQADPATKDYSFETLDRNVQEVSAKTGTEEAASAREEAVGEMRAIIRQARHREDLVLGDRKFKSADRDAAVANLGLMVRDGKSIEEQASQQIAIDRLKGELDQLSVRYDYAKEHRVKLDKLLKQITREEDEAKESLANFESESRQLDEANKQRRSTFITWDGMLPLPGKKILELPIFDAFNSPRKIDNLWSDGLEIFYNFRYVRRFDRCTTCHQLLPKTMPGSATDPAYEHEFLVDFELDPRPADDASGAAAPPADTEKANSEKATAQVAAASNGNAGPETFADKLKKALGLQIASEGLLSPNDATIQAVVPESIAAKARLTNEANTEARPKGDALKRGVLQPVSLATQGSPVPPGLLVGDVIVAINGNPVMQPGKVARWLVDEAAAQKPFVITVRRGVPNPFTSHPRLDLFVGSLSPHKMSEFACTICHEGQGSATNFQWASHTPNTVRERKDWSFEHKWFDNPHWIFPMYPERFAESSCLKCHHEVAELESSERFADPAPKLIRGFHLIRKYGCYGCHEINGFDGKKRIGPDLRLEPNVFAAAQQLRADPGFEQLPADEKDWVDQLIAHPDRDSVRRRLLESLESEAKSEKPRLSEETLDKLTPLFRDVESAGTLRKAGPSLRFAGHKLTEEFLYDWIREPKSFRPTTRMPQFFEQHKHLMGSPSLEDAQQFEPLEILGIVTYLKQRTQAFDYLEPPEGINAGPDKDRGRIQFQTRGCLACHSHKAFADAEQFRGSEEIVQGPDLSRVGDKFTGENGAKWLYSWIKAPSRYHARTVMPDLFLDPITTTAPDDPEKKTVSDPAADIVAFLLTESKSDWKPDPTKLRTASKVKSDELNAFVVSNLAEAFARHKAEEYATRGIPESLRAELKGAEVELVVPDGQQGELSNEKKLLYLGKRSIAKYGCYGCHDVPGFEDAKPIGTGLADWGRKDSAKLAFEHITHYLDHGHGSIPHADTHSGTAAHMSVSTEPHADADSHAAEHADESDEDREYYLEQLKAGHRAGFIYQKLLEPRSFDYHKTENKRYNERLRMPQFPFTGDEREAVITFVLGLVADPPSAKYIYRPNEKQKSILAGRQALEKYNCGGCHILSPEKWRIALQRGKTEPQTEVDTFPYVRAHFAPASLDASTKADRSGLVRATVSGMPALDGNGEPIVNDDLGDALDPETAYDPQKVETLFELWRPTVIDGKPFDVGVSAIAVTSKQLEQRTPADGGFLARYLLPHVVALEKQVNSEAKGNEAWGWLPPPLHTEGSKVQSDWLHEFLLDPYPIRPATFLRMPRFNMSPAEATNIVNYFAALDGAEYPYSYDTRQQSKYLQSAESAYDSKIQGEKFEDKPRTRLDDAMRIVVNNNYCVKCHLVGDFEPKGSDRAKAPNLALVHRRLRPDYARKWIANPKAIHPYTSMPVNVVYKSTDENLGGVSQDLYRGTSVEQVDALVDLLMNFDEYSKRKTSVTDLVNKYGGMVDPNTPGAGGTTPPTTPEPKTTTGAN